jgi:indole-3-glycerol phosphate synthase
MRNIFKPEQKEGMFTPTIFGSCFQIPKWTKIAKTYNEAVEKALSVLAKERNFYNWREGKLNKVATAYKNPTISTEIG